MVVVERPETEPPRSGHSQDPNDAGYVILGDAWYSGVGPLLR